MADLPPDTYLGFRPSHLLAGAIGGICGALASPSGSIWRHITMGIVGTAVAAYGTPVVAPMVALYLASHNVPLGSIEGPTGFALGVCGMSLCKVALRWVQIWRDGPMPKLPPAG